MAKDEKGEGCPDRNCIEQFLMDPCHPENAVVAAHIYVCKSCQETVQAAIYKEEYSLSDEEINTIGDFVKRYCKPSDALRRLRLWVFNHPPIPRAVENSGMTRDWRMAAARRSCDKDINYAGGETVCFVYLSITSSTDPLGWKAVLEVPGVVDHLTQMKLRVIHGGGEPAVGEFSLNGIKVDLKNGASFIPYKSFVEGMHDSEIYLKSDSGKKIYGTLVIA